MNGGPDALQTGLYIADARDVENDAFYVIYWPEKTTWERNVSASVSRNRVTFLRFALQSFPRFWSSKFLPRYLTKLCEQVICLISDEDEAQLHWDPTDITGLAGEATSASKPASRRAYRLRVQHVNHQQESARTQDGFTVCHSPPNRTTLLTFEGWLWPNISWPNY